MKSRFIVSFLLVASLYLSSCSENEAPVVSKTATEVPTSKMPFPFYRNIEIRPGLTFEIVSWGKFVDSVGGFTILLSDSLKNNYKSVAIARKGIIKDAYNLDLDTDGNPELYIEVLKNKNESDLMVYEFADNDFNKISFPSLSSNIRKSYMGNDKFFIKNGELFRSIPVKQVAENGTSSTLVQNVRYVLRGNSFDIKEVE